MTVTTTTKLEQLSFISEHRARIESQLAQCFAANTAIPTTLHQAMRYSVLNGGKRIRALLVYASGQCLNANTAALDTAAISVELIHSYSLIHDDLPAMDDDDLRRGKPSCHKAFNEATAILAGDALQSLAFELLSAKTPHYQTTTQIAIINLLSKAIGRTGMVAGQMLDIEGEQQALDAQAVEQMHCLKTAALIRASVLIGATIANADLKTLKLLDQFSQVIGLAFQIKDDILDQQGKTAQLGKTAGSDKAKGKATAINSHGLNAAKQRTQTLLIQAQACLSQLPNNTNVLSTLADYILSRNH